MLAPRQSNCPGCLASCPAGRTTGRCPQQHPAPAALAAWRVGLGSLATCTPEAAHSLCRVGAVSNSAGKLLAHPYTVPTDKGPKLGANRTFPTDRTDANEPNSDIEQCLNRSLLWSLSRNRVLLGEAFEKIAALYDNCLVLDHYQARLLPLMHNFIDALAGNTHQIADLPLREMNLNQRSAIHLLHFGRSQQSYRETTS